jgi:lysine N6-hydroxylase
LRETEETAFADHIILATGFRNDLPPCLEGLLSRLSFDSDGRLEIRPSFRLVWDGPESAKIYALNFGRHSHGIAEPQTSLMAWRSATILNDLLPEPRYRLEDEGAGFIAI